MCHLQAFAAGLEDESGATSASNSECERGSDAETSSDVSCVASCLGE